MIDRHIFLIGMPGCGKSSLGKRVAGQLRIPYADTDARVCDAVGFSVTEIFARCGEEAFRNAETNVLIGLTRETPSLVSTGGGLVMREINRQIMRNHGIVILIDRPVSEIMSDIRLDRRPLLREKGVGEVKRLYEERIATYRAVADAVLDNSQGYQMGVYNLDRLIRSLFPD